MGFETDKAQATLQDEFNGLTLEKDRLEVAVQKWVDRATVLHTGATGADYKADVIAMRDTLVLALRTSLGV